MYRELKEKDGSAVQGYVQRLADNAVIPFDPANSDYQEYLKWLDAGNKPLPAEGKNG